MAAQLCHAHTTYIDVVEILHPGLPCCEEFTREAATEYLRAAIGNHVHERVAFGKKKKTIATAATRLEKRQAWHWLEDM
jgi:hypothetical protein